MTKKPQEPCNLCGETLQLDEHNSGGLENVTVMGNYSSTPGNGSGALDDTTQYTFSLCEFCLDWLFQQFRVPVVVVDRDGGPEPFRPAAERVCEDDWRKMKRKFVDETSRRARLRTQL